MNLVFWDTIFLLTGSFFSYGQVPENSTSASTTQSTPTTPATPTASPATSTVPSPTVSSTTTTTTTISSTTTHHPVRKFVAAAVHSHFDDCPDSHSQFCFHGTCRFLILEETAACICHPGFVGMRCEHADLLAVVATNHGQHTVATMLVLCVVGCVMLMLLFTLLNCWWRRGGCERGRLLPCFSEKPSSILKARTSCCHSETVV
ncbi:protransforming growth factor alpha [Sardina pilchardus]|uniref:protransforming growth factor alpha n=1 Tax=Sardina pilchardus TaxID=27697 RepID=UPI002E10F668